MHCASDSILVPARQQGYTLLLVLLVLLVGGTSVYLTARDPGSARASQALQQTAVALDRATVALQFYSIADDDRPGSLPCPDEDGSGETALFSGDECPVYIGRLPWRTIDAAREVGSLWYVMDRDFRDHGSAQPLNVTLEGSLSLNDESGYAALIIDPGEPLAGQTGRPGDDPSDYLDDENADGDEDFLDCADLDDCNDRVTGIRVDLLFEVVQRRVLAEVEQRLRAFYLEDDRHYLPYAAAFSGDLSCDSGTFTGRVATTAGTCELGGGPVNKTLRESDFVDADAEWIIDNEWLEHVVYHVANACAEFQSDCVGSDLELASETGMSVVLGAAGTVLAGQDRVSISRDIDDFLDSDENTDGDKIYDDAPFSETDNDIMRAFSLSPP